MNNRLLELLPSVNGDEILFLDQVTKNLSDDEMKRFALMYRGKRQQPEMVLLLCILGFFGVAGVHRFYVNQIAMGVIYLLTGGLCMVGTIVDIVNYKKLTLEYNEEKALEILDLLHL